jgi:hypothetical protein
LKALANDRDGAANCGIERRTINEDPRCILIPYRWRAGIGPLLDTNARHTARWNVVSVGTVNRRCVAIISRGNAHKKPAGGVCRNGPE